MGLKELRALISFSPRRGLLKNFLYFLQFSELKGKQSAEREGEEPLESEWNFFSLYEF